MHHHHHDLHRLERYTMRRDFAERDRAIRAEERREQQFRSDSGGNPRSRPQRRIELKPLTFEDRSGNEMRPASFDEMVGQERLKGLFRRIVANVKATGRPLGHIMLSGQSGTGKTTLAQVTAHELGRRVFQVKAPVSLEVLDALADACQDRDIVIVDEIHQQVVGDRRGITQAAQPEDFYHVMEDRRLPTADGMRPFPAVTFIGCTTDAGLLPEAFLGRFPLRPTLDPYTDVEMARLAHASAAQLGMRVTPDAAMLLGRAARQNPRQVNDYILNARDLTTNALDRSLALEVVTELNGSTLDGLTPDMQAMLRFLLTSRRESKDGTVVYQASVNTIATALGKSRDTKAVALYVEPWLIGRGLVQVTHGGRQLTPAGIQRAQELVEA